MMIWRKGRMWLESGRRERSTQEVKRIEGRGKRKIRRRDDTK